MIVAGLLASLVILNVLYVFHMERKDRRHDEQVNRLLVHIHAPEVAVMERQVSQFKDLPAVQPDLDEDYWSAQEAALERIARIEAGEG